MFWGAHRAPSHPLCAAFPSIPGLSWRKGGRAWFTDAAVSLWTESSPGTAPDVHLLFRGWGRAALTQGDFRRDAGSRAGEQGLWREGGQPCHLLGLPRQYGACLQGTEVPVEGGQDGSRQKENKRRSAESAGTLGQGRKHLCLGRSGPAGAGAQAGGVLGRLEASLRSPGPDGAQEGDPRWVQVPMPSLRVDLGEPLPYQPCPPEKRPGLWEGGWREGSALKVGCLGALQFHLPLRLAEEASRRWVRPLCDVCGGPLTSWCRQRPRCLQAVGRPPPIPLP